MDYNDQENVEVSTFENFPENHQIIEEEHTEKNVTEIIPPLELKETTEAQTLLLKMIITNNLIPEEQINLIKKINNTIFLGILLTKVEDKDVKIAVEKQLYELSTMGRLEKFKDFKPII